MAEKRRDYFAAGTQREGRELVSHDQKPIPRHFANFILYTTCPGVLIIPQHLSVSVAVEDRLLIWFLTEAEEWTNRIRYLPL